ncbi:MAG: ABC transporter substrate-binding protein, partial [Desulfobulbaceae bacterium]|nr:ABC transporter substrate-binding protein [Desulfobulbaceae bacterium]
MRFLGIFLVLFTVGVLVPAPNTQASSVLRGETLVLMHGGSQGQWTDVGIANPYAAGFSHQQGNAAWLEPLFYYSAFSGKTIPWLAESYHYNKDFTELTVKVRHNVYWSDGHPFTAKDVAFTFTMLKKHAPLLRNSAEIREWVKSIDVLDDVTLKFVFVSPKPQFHFSHLSFKFDSGVYVVPEHIFKTVDDPLSFSFYDLQKGWPVVTGGYQITEWSPQKKVLDYQENWWAVKSGLAKKPKVKRLLFIPFSDESRAVQMMINNQIDMSIDLRPTTIKQAVAQNKNIITHTLRESPYG